MDCGSKIRKDYPLDEVSLGDPLGNTVPDAQNLEDNRLTQGGVLTHSGAAPGSR